MQGFIFKCQSLTKQVWLWVRANPLTAGSHCHMHVHSVYSCLCHRPSRQTVNVMGGGRACDVRAMCVCLCVYQLSVSMVSTTPELADSRGSKVKAEPVWAS